MYHFTDILDDVPETQWYFSDVGHNNILVQHMKNATGGTTVNKKQLGHYTIDIWCLVQPTLIEYTHNCHTSGRIRKLNVWG